MTQILRTPGNRFDSLPDYPFQPSYLHINSNLPDINQPLRVHYIDECHDRNNVSETILLLHGMHTINLAYLHTQHYTYTKTIHMCIVLF